MAEARNLKAREYNTNIFGAPDKPSAPVPSTPMRDTNTFKSSAFSTEMDNSSRMRGENKREGIFKERPLTAQVARASYQDSNIFGYKKQINDREHKETIQRAAQVPEKDPVERFTNTFRSQIFGGNQSNGGLRERNTNTFNSNVFG